MTRSHNCFSGSPPQDSQPPPDLPTAAPNPASGGSPLPTPQSPHSFLAECWVTSLPPATSLVTRGPDKVATMGLSLLQYCRSRLRDQGFLLATLPERGTLQTTKHQPPSATSRLPGRNRPPETRIPWPYHHLRPRLPFPSCYLGAWDLFQVSVSSKVPVSAIVQAPLLAVFPETPLGWAGCTMFPVNIDLIFSILSSNWLCFLWGGVPRGVGL